MYPRHCRDRRSGNNLIVCVCDARTSFTDLNLVVTRVKRGTASLRYQIGDHLALATSVADLPDAIPAWVRRAMSNPDETRSVTIVGGQMVISFFEEIVDQVEEAVVKAAEALVGSGGLALEGALATSA